MRRGTHAEQFEVAFSFPAVGPIQYPIEALINFMVEDVEDFVDMAVQPEFTSDDRCRRYLII